MANRTKVDFIPVGEMTDMLFGDAQKMAQTNRDTAQAALTTGRERITELISSGDFDAGMTLHKELTDAVSVSVGQYKAAMAGVDMKALAADFLGTSMALHIENAKKYEPEPYTVLEEAILSLKGYAFVPEKQESGEILLAFTAPPTRKSPSGGNGTTRTGEQSLTGVIMGSNTGKPVTKITVWGPTPEMCDLVGVPHDTERISFPRPGQQSKGLWPLRNFLEFVAPLSEGILSPDIATSGDGSMYVVSGYEQWVAASDAEGLAKANLWFVVPETRDVNGVSTSGYRKVVLHKGFRSECTEYDATAIICHMGAQGVTHYNGETVIFHTEEIDGVVVRDAGGTHIGTRDLGRKSFQGWDNATPKEAVLESGGKSWAKVWGPVYGWQGEAGNITWQSHPGIVIDTTPNTEPAEDNAPVDEVEPTEEPTTEESTEHNES